MTKGTTFSLLLFLLLPVLAQAMPCHCYSVRDFNPQEPAAADPYYLATSQNAFFSIIFGMEKKSVIFAKQKPRATAEGLWVVNWLSTTTGLDEKTLKKERKNQGAWDKALEEVGAQTKTLPPAFQQLLNQGAEDKALAQFIVDKLLKDTAKIPDKELQALRAGRATNKEAILATFIGGKTAQSPSTLYRRVISGETTWGALLLAAGMNGREMVKEINILVGKKEND